MAELLLWLLGGIPASQRQQLAGSESPSPAQKCKPGDTRVSGWLSLPTVEPGLWEAALGVSHVPWPHIQPFSKARLCQCKVGPLPQASERDSDSTAQCPALAAPLPKPLPFPRGDIGSWSEQSPSDLSLQEPSTSVHFPNK